MIADRAAELIFSIEWEFMDEETGVPHSLRTPMKLLIDEIERKGSKHAAHLAATAHATAQGCRPP